MRAEYPKACVAVSLAWAAGYIDVASWLLLQRVYVSHMTGNTSDFARNLSTAQWTEAFHHGWVILPFVAGLLYSAGATKAARRHGFHSSFSIALVTELILLAAFIALEWLHFETSICYCRCWPPRRASKPSRSRISTVCESTPRI